MRLIDPANDHLVRPAVSRSSSRHRWATSPYFVTQNDVILASSPCLSLHQACSDPLSAKAAGFIDPPSRTLSKVPKLANAYVRGLVRMVRTAQNSGSAGPSVQACRSSAALSAGANTGLARRSHRALDAGALALTAAKTFR